MENSQPPGSPPDSQLSTLNSQLSFSPLPGETPRAFNAFLAFFHLGQQRSHQAVADQLDESLYAVQHWSCKYCWSDRIRSFDSGLLQQQIQAQAALRRQQVADWARRSNEYLELEWAAAQKLISAAQCFLESFGDRELQRMSLGQVSRALQIASRLARQSLTGAAPTPNPSPTPTPSQP